MICCWFVGGLVAQTGWQAACPTASFTHRLLGLCLTCMPACVATACVWQVKYPFHDSPDEWIKVSQKQLLLLLLYSRDQR